MIFSARSRLPASTACQASSASLRARRRSLVFCFLGFMASSSSAARAKAPFGAVALGAHIDFGIRSRFADGASSRSAAARGQRPYGWGALTEEDLADHSHGLIIDAATGRTRQPAVSNTPQSRIG